MADFEFQAAVGILVLRESELEAFEEILETAAETGDLSPDATELVNEIIERLNEELG